MFNDFPYFDYHDINLDWIISRMKEFLASFKGLEADYDEFKKYVQNYLGNIEVNEEVERILDEWYEDGKIQEMLLQYNTTMLTSNDIDVELLYNYILADNRTKPDTPSNYSIFQAMCMTEGGNFIVLCSDENSSSNQGMIREINSGGNYTGKQALVEVGHCNGCAYVNGKIYVAWMHEYPSDSRTGKISIIDYATFTVDRIVDIGVDISSLTYDSDNDNIICAGYLNGNVMPMYVLDTELRGIVRTFNIVREPWMALNQDIAYYNGMIVYISAFPNSLCFFDVNTGEFQKVYNLPQRAGIGLPFNEPESCEFYNGNFYLCGFARLDDYTSYNNIVKINPWKNTYTGYYKYNRFSGQKIIYVDGDQRDPVQDGTEEHPFGHIMQAVSVLTSDTNITTSLMPIYCKTGTNVGALVFLGIDNLVVNRWGDSGQYQLYGVRIASSQGVIINNAEILYNRTASTGSANAYNLNSRVQYQNCIFNSEDGDEYTAENKMALFATNGSEVLSSNNTIPDTFSTGMQANGRSIFRQYGGSNNAARQHALYEDAVIKNPQTIKPQNDIWNRKSEALTLVRLYGNQIVDNGEYDFEATNVQSFDGFNFVVIETVLSGRETHLVFKASNNFNFNVTLGHKYTNFWIGDVEGNINFNTKKITINRIVTVNTKTGDQFVKGESTATGISYPYINGVYLF